MPEQLLSQSSSTFDNLIAGDQIDPISKEFTLLTGQNVVRGTLLGKITASGKLVKSLSAAGDGSEVPYAIAAKDLDATASDLKIVAYIAGIFNSNAMVFGTAHTADSVFDGLRALGIYLVESYPTFD